MGTRSSAVAVRGARIATRALGLLLLAAAVAAGRFGADNELENLAPALVVGAAWPALLLGSALLGAVWVWLDPWDTLARVLRADDREVGPGDVRWALLPAGIWVYYLTVRLDSTRPRVVGAALAGYTLVVLAGALAVGRQRFLERAEVFGIVASWLARLRRRRIRQWNPPRGADLLLGILGGGLLFGGLRVSELWYPIEASAGAQLWAALGLLGCAATAAVVLRLCATRAARWGDGGIVVAAAVPVVAAIGIATGMGRNRFTTSLQLLPGLLGDPMGSGWDLLGSAGAVLQPEPLGTTGLIVAQVVVLLVGALVGARVSAARAPTPQARGTAVGAIGVLLTAGILAVTVPVL